MTEKNSMKIEEIEDEIGDEELFGQEVLDESSIEGGEKFDDLSSSDINKSSIASRKKRLLKKAPDAPKRFKSAYICFVTDKMETVKKQLEADTKVRYLCLKCICYDII
jgi:hypothetical protein